MILGLVFIAIFNQKALRIPNCDKFTQNFIGQIKYVFSVRRSKIGQKFLSPAEIWPLEEFSITLFWAYFSKILTLEVAGGPKFRAFCPKFFPAGKICIF